MNYKNDKLAKNQEERINKLLEFQKVKNSEEKEFRNKQKKLQKKLKLVSEKESEMKLEKAAKKSKTKADENQNETILDDLSNITTGLPNDNLLEPFVEHDSTETDSTYTHAEETSHEVLKHVETEIRDKIKDSIRKKLEARQESEFFSKEELKVIEAELMNEMEKEI